MKNKYKRLVSVIICAVMLFVCGTAANCAESPQPDRKGSIIINMKNDGQSVAGGEVSLYYIAFSVNGVYTLTEDFSDSGLDISGSDYEVLASHFASYVASRAVKGKAEKIGSDGRAVFASLEQGVYLVVQNKAADGYRTINPFIVTVPVYEDGIYIYDIDASPKFELVSEPDTVTETVTASTEPTTSSPTVESSYTHTETSSHENTTEPQLPQTGQLNWPVPMLAFSGLFLIVVGVMINGKKKDEDEE